MSQPEAADNKSTNMESANTITKSIFSSKAVNMALTQKAIRPKDFKVHCLLGTGSFGDVYLVEKRDTKRLYAMKVLLKENIFSRLGPTQNTT